MSYLNQSFVDFFKILSNNNSKEWFDKNRKTYEKEVKKPFSILVTEMIDRIQEYEPKMHIKASEAIIRINRDIRFSKDKTPYRTHVGANISIYGKKDKSYPSFAFQISPEEVVVYGGIYMVEKDVLQNIRQHISENLTAFQSAYNEKSFKEKFGNIQGEKHKRIPSEFQKIAEKEPLVTNKQFYYSATLSPKIITSEKLPEKLMEYYKTGKKVSDFLSTAYERNK